MSELQRIIEQAYEMAKSGHWDQLLSDWAHSAVLANRCSRFTEPGSGWSFLHHAACLGNEQACRVLISRGASVEALTHDSRSPAEIAGQGMAVFQRCLDALDAAASDFWMTMYKETSPEWKDNA